MSQHGKSVIIASSLPVAKPTPELQEELEKAEAQVKKEVSMKELLNGPDTKDSEESK